MTAKHGARHFSGEEIRAAVFSLLDQSPGFQNNTRELRRAVEKHLGWTLGMDEVAKHRRAWLLDVAAAKQNAEKEAAEAKAVAAANEETKRREDEQHNLAVLKAETMAEEKKTEKKRTRGGPRRLDRDEFLRMLLEEHPELVPTAAQFGKGLLEVEDLRLAMIAAGWKTYEHNSKHTNLSTYELQASLRRLHRHHKLPQRRVTNGFRPIAAPKPGNVVINVIDDQTARILALAEAGLRVAVAPDGTLTVEKK